MLARPGTLETSAFLTCTELRASKLSLSQYMCVIISRGTFRSSHFALSQNLMEAPTGFVAQLWSFISFLPFFLLLFTLGLLKGTTSNGQLRLFLLLLLFFFFIYKSLMRDINICHSCDNRTYSYNNNPARKLGCDNWPLASSFSMDLLLRCKVSSSSFHAKKNVKIFFFF